MNNQKRFTFLVADDEYPVVKIICDILTLHPSTVSIFTANDGEKALQLYKNNKIDIVITDILMPRLSGLELIKKLKEVDGDSHIIVVSAYNNIDLVREAMRNGAYDYILKPFAVDEIMFSVNRVIDRLKLLDEKKTYVTSLETAVKDATENLHQSFFDTLKAILNALEARDKHTLEHCNNVAIYSEKIARKLSIEKNRIQNINVGGVLHDIGKIGVPDSILLKSSKLSAEEYSIIKSHPETGKKIILPILNNNPDIMDIIYYHHERFDGTGYPEGLKGESIPLVARIAAIANAYDSMISDRSYQKAKSLDEALEDIKANRGTQFDPEIAKVFIDTL